MSSDDEDLAGTEDLAGPEGAGCTGGVIGIEGFSSSATGCGSWMTCGGEARSRSALFFLRQCFSRLKQARSDNKSIDQDDLIETIKVKINEMIKTRRSEPRLR